MSIKRAVRSILRKTGYDVVRYDVSEDARARRLRLMESSGVNCVLDVGANQGEYALILRDGGFQGEIHSFEPLSSAYARLQRRAVQDGSWRAYPMALGEEEGEALIHVAGNSYSSSLLGMAEAHRRLAPESAYVGTERVAVRRLDALWADLEPAPGTCLLKIDTQGFELAVLRGAGDVLSRCPLIELELSFVELYEGQPLFGEVVAWMAEQGYRPVSFETGPGQVDASTGQTLQNDVIFLRA